MYIRIYISPHGIYKRIKHPLGLITKILNWSGFESEGKAALLPSSPASPQLSVPSFYPSFLDREAWLSTSD